MTTNIYVADGDSTTFGAGVKTPFTGFLTLNGPWSIINKGVNGELLSTMLANAPTNIDPLYVPGVLNVVTIWGGLNDLASSVTPATCYSNLQAYCAARRAVGWKVIVATLVSNKFVDNTRDQLNALLRANHRFADGLVDFAGTPLDVDGGWADTTWFQSDGVHPNEAGITTYEVPLWNAAINAQIPAGYFGTLSTSAPPFSTSTLIQGPPNAPNVRIVANGVVFNNAA